MKNIFILLISLLLISCEGIVRGEGKIISAKDKKPLDSVLVYWTNLNEKSYSDSLGHFEIGQFCGCIPDCPELEIITYKKGYKTNYLNLTKDDKLYDTTLVIEMQPVNTYSETIEENNFTKILKYVNLIILIFNAFTLIIICCIELRYKWVWIVSLIIFNLHIKYNYISDDFLFDPFSFFIQLRFLTFYYHVGWYIFYIPTTAIVFWSYYFVTKSKRKLTDN
jgi:hypothetical protein